MRTRHHKRMQCCALVLTRCVSAQQRGIIDEHKRGGFQQLTDGQRALNTARIQSIFQATTGFGVKTSTRARGSGRRRGKGGERGSVRGRWTDRSSGSRGNTMVPSGMAKIFTLEVLSEPNQSQNAESCKRRGDSDQSTVRLYRYLFRSVLPILRSVL